MALGLYTTGLMYMVERSGAPGGDAGQTRLGHTQATKTEIIHFELA